jgi:hypothetical protein
LDRSPRGSADPKEKEKEKEETIPNQQNTSYTESVKVFLMGLLVTALFEQYKAI